MIKSYLSAAIAATVLSATLFATQADAQYSKPAGARPGARATAPYTNPTRPATQSAARPATTRPGAPVASRVAPQRQPAASMMAAAGGVKIALLDVSLVFKNHTRFKARMEDMKVRLKMAEDRLTAERTRLQKMQAQVREFKPGTPDYKKLEMDFAKGKASLAVSAEMTQKEFVEMEARIYFDVYNEIQQAVHAYCSANGISLVWRYSSTKPDVARPDTVLAHINKPVVYHANGLDITNAILQQVNRAHLSAARTPTSPPVGVGGRRR